MFFFGGRLRRVTAQQLVSVDRLGRDPNILSKEDGRVNALGSDIKQSSRRESTHAECSLRRGFEQSSKVLQLLGRKDVDVRSQIVKAARLGPEPLEILADELCELVNFCCFAGISVSEFVASRWSGAAREEPACARAYLLAIDALSARARVRVLQGGSHARLLLSASRSRARGGVVVSLAAERSRLRLVGSRSRWQQPWRRRLG